MNTTVLERQPTQSQASGAETNEFDILIVGAGISGLGCAHYIQENFPEKSIAIVEKHDKIGGTWLIHRYPGARSDSDLFTFGYKFKPWMGQPIGTRKEILNYLSEIVQEDKLEERIRFNTEVKKASWSSEESKWTLHCQFDGKDVEYKGTFLLMCPGYYKHEEANTPHWEGFEKYKGKVIHPQMWPEDYDYTGKRIIVIGSGATAATLVPALTDKAEKVIMVQRSPTYFYCGRNGNDLLDELRRLDVDPAWIHEIMRKKNIRDRDGLVARAQQDPEGVRKELLGDIRKRLRDDLPLEPHWVPRYDPWTQRVAFLPDGDLVEAVNQGKAEVVTDEIDEFTETGIKMKSGQLVEADVVVTATGFLIEKLGNIALEVDGKEFNWADSVTFRGMMFTGLPNMIYMLGYWTFSWTLRVDIVSAFLVRLIKYMDDQHVTSIMPKLRPEEEKEERLGWVDRSKFNPGYTKNVEHLWPKRLDKEDWQHSQNYPMDKEQFPKINFDDDIFVKTYAK